MPNHNFIDLTGQTFNWAFVESRAENDSAGRAMWNCLCLRCGTRFVANGKNLRNGNTKSCGCLRKQLAHDRKFEDLTGRIFERLYVEGLYKQDDRGKSVWECCCICNNKVFATTAALKSGAVKSCGCYTRDMTIQRNKIDLTGRQCGWLLPEYIVDHLSGLGFIWRCKCLRCGGYADVAAQYLTSGNKTSCGCLLSRGEQRVADFLNDNNIQYQKQKRFIGCKNKNSLMFDFYLPDYNIVIEYDGELHYTDGNGFSDLKYQQNNDRIKDKYCEENDIILIRIPYWEKDNIEQILTDQLLLDAEEANSSDVDLSA